MVKSLFADNLHLGDNYTRWRDDLRQQRAQGWAGGQVGRHTRSWAAFRETCWHLCRFPVKEWHRADDLAEDGRGDGQAGRGVALQDAQPAGVGLLRERQLGRALQPQQGSAQVSQRGEQVAWKQDDNSPCAYAKSTK